MTNSDSTAAQGDVAKIDWPAVLAQHRGWLRTVILARLGEAQAVEEVMQEVSLAAVRQSVPLRDSTKVARLVALSIGGDSVVAISPQTRATEEIAGSVC